MTTSELISYIKKQMNNGLSKELIESKLIGAGWRKEDVVEGFQSIEQKSKKDEYREPVIEIKQPRQEKKVDNIVDSVIEKSDYSKEEDGNEEAKKVPVLEIKPESNSETEIEEYKVEIPEREAPKVWVPRMAPIIKEEVKKEEVKNEVIEEKKEVEMGTKIAINKIEIKKEEPKKIEDINKKPELEKAQNIMMGDEFIPTLVPKPKMDPLSQPKTDQLIEKLEQKDFGIKDLSKIAMLSSYSKDLMSVNKAEVKKKVVRNNIKIIKLLIVIIPIVIVLGSLSWALASGKLNLSKINIPFIKKDPKVLILNYSSVLLSLGSYKTETNIEITSPSFASISSGLISGEAASLPDKDNISINVLGSVNKKEAELLADSFITVKGSILPSYITSDIKNDGKDLYISIPDLSKVVKQKTPEVSIVKINEEQFSLVPAIFSEKIEASLKKINLYKLLSGGVSSHINIDILNSFDELISSVEVIEKGGENIKGIDTYHYSINVDRQLSKKLLTKVSENFTLNLSDFDKNNLTEILGATTINSLEVWIGKGDNNIYQYNVILDIPLSKIVGFEDKSIGNNPVVINWKTTYYDFNTPNSIFIPDTFIQAVDFIKTTKQLKLKNDVSSLGILSTVLFNIEKGYGVKSNGNGSCMNPTSGSLFSPTGHNKNSTIAISSISTLLNNIFKTTNGSGYCYSNPKAWSFTVPIADSYEFPEGVVPEYKNFFCVDSIGFEGEITSSPKGTMCLPPIPAKQ
jgi:hypothetical protein